MSGIDFFFRMAALECLSFSSCVLGGLGFRLRPWLSLSMLWVEKEIYLVATTLVSNQTHSGYSEPQISKTGLWRQKLFVPIHCLHNKERLECLTFSCEQLTKKMFGYEHGLVSSRSLRVIFRLQQKKEAKNRSRTSQKNKGTAPLKVMKN
jgi:hypothetical protein